ncbi:TetR/AcrR family transcriptional regulator [Marinobacterium rhizophilum]|uniref:TetR/AcrR family transcriptional regulator n=1 Tax=Marinobacterium rhizophilum TaxID=420402 RepID=A0ABY5HN88_9GAMM|nr:TetR/AcrR family transcriptional regulator [Marinobacterium rhizophilum]UTW13038.1 TetR/AcrR family transcriptional regulator [Marinobacterium rhizophilum]
MTRVQFDREAVIQDCTRLFWQQGFSGASMQDVVKATGLKPGSLYLAFGNKEGLYQAALDHYARQSRETLRQTLESAPSVGVGLCRQLLRMLDEASRTDYCSCFLVKSQLELAASGGELHRKICSYLGQIENIYVEYLVREYPPLLAQQRAASLMMHVFGIRVYGYLGRERETQVAALQSGLPWLPWDASLAEGI